jgi:hypothetical protein
MKNSTFIIYFYYLIMLGTFCTLETSAQKSADLQNTFVPIKVNGRAFNFFIVSDWGWNGFKSQQEVADGMAMLADSIEPKFIVSCGDNFQIQGVASAQDPLWLTSYENIYKKPSLQVDWYPVLGNHDYRGNTQAEIDYSAISRRWRMESHYYKNVVKVNDSISALLVFLDTSPLVDEYYKKPGYPDVFKQDSAKQMIWLKNVLANSKEQWKLVFGHHPVYSASTKHGNTPELIRRLKPLFETYHVQFYICGHDHDMQHLKEKEGTVNYIVTGTSGEPRPASSNDLSIFSKSVPGFSMISFNADKLEFYFIDSKGKPVYTIKRNYKD